MSRIEDDGSLVPLEQRLVTRHPTDLDSSTDFYGRIIGMFEGGGSVSLNSVADLMTSAGERLDVGQQAEVTSTIGAYVADSIARGQLKDLEGLHRVLDLVGPMSLSLDPEHSERVNFYHTNLKPMQIERILLWFHSGELTQAVYSLPLSEIPDDKRLPEAERRMGRAVAYVQSLLPCETVTEDTISEIRQYGEILQLMNGRNAALDEISHNLGYALTRICERTSSSELPELRRAIPYEGRRLLEASK